MSDNGEVYRDGIEDQDAFGPNSYCQVYWGKDEDQPELPEVAHRHFAYSKWNICMNLSTLGVEGTVLGSDAAEEARTC